MDIPPPPPPQGARVVINFRGLLCSGFFFVTPFFEVPIFSQVQGRCSQCDQISLFFGEPNYEIGSKDPIF